MPSAEHPRTVVLGLGNMLMADDGVGLAALTRLEENWFLTHDVALVDGGTWGMNLLPVIEGADRLLILDAIDVGRPPGTEIRLEGDEIPRALGQKLSPHQIDLREVLALAQLRGTIPESIIALGIQPGRIELSTSLTPAVAARLDHLVDLAAATLQQWGIRVTRWTVDGGPTPAREGAMVSSPTSHRPSPVSSYA